MTIPQPVTLGPCTMYHGDCLDVFQELPRTDAVITDPPYGTKVTEWDQSITSEHINGCLNATAGYRLFFYSNTRLWHLLGEVKAAGFEAWTLVWHKSNAMGFERRFAPQWVPVVCAYKGNPPFWGKDLHMCPIIPQDVDHPTPKPIGITQWLVERATKKDELVLDPFMGSGTTGIACIRTGRKFIGIEKDPKHFKTACERIERELQQQRLAL